MKMKTILAVITALILTSGVSWSADGDEAESTIRLMGAAEANLPEAVTKNITLPAAVAEDTAAVEKAVSGLANADENRQRREKGLSQADDARERGAEIADEAQDNRESRGRSEDRPEPPSNPGPPSN